MSAHTLAEALATLGLVATVDARDRLAVLALDDASPLTDAALRKAVTSLAAEHGFTHVALELPSRRAAEPPSRR